MARSRADLLIVARGLAESRAKARAAIEAGGVTADGAPVTKASDLLAEDAALEVAPPHPWVSRGGVKLAHALDVFGVDPAGGVCLDVGASTGGFTQVLLERGAAKVYAVDVGSPRHGEARTWLEEQLSGVETFAFPVAVLLAFVRLSTQGRIFASPLAPREAFDIIEGWLAQPCATTVVPGERHLVLVRELLDDARGVDEVEHGEQQGADGEPKQIAENPQVIEAYLGRGAAASMNH